MVDLSGDGRDNRGPRVAPARARALLAGITVNGLAILNDEPFLDRYFERQVIAGADAFVVAAADYHDFAEAIVRKLVREIAGPQLVRPAAPPDAGRVRPCRPLLGACGRADDPPQQPRRRRCAGT